MKNFIKIISALGLVTGLLIAFATSLQTGAQSYSEPVETRVAEIVEVSEPKPTPVPKIEGVASYYNREICELHGTVYGSTCKTRNGEIFDDQDMIAACPKSKLGKYIIVTYGNKSVTVRCTDTGSFGEKYSRVLDLSQGAFEKLAPSSKGIIKVSYEEKSK